MIGILPNQLIRMITEVKPDDKDAILKDLRLTSFWQGYRVWRQRMNLYREYWRDKVPTCLKGKPEVLDKCVNPFHYLTLVNPTKAPPLEHVTVVPKLSKKNKRKLLK